MTPEQRNNLLVGVMILLLFFIVTVPQNRSTEPRKSTDYTKVESTEAPDHKYKYVKYFDLLDPTLNGTLKEFFDAKDFNNTQGKHIPRNITHVNYYAGNWKTSNTEGFQIIPLNRSVIDLTRLPPSLYKYNSEGVFYLGKLKRVYRGAGSPADTIYEGSFAIRDGIYSTDRAKEFSLRGLYLWNSGLMLAVGCDLDATPFEIPSVHFDVNFTATDKEIITTFFEGKSVIFDALKGQITNKVCPLKLAVHFRASRNISDMKKEDIKREIADFNNDKLIVMNGYVFSNYHKQMLTLNGKIYSTHERRDEAIFYLVYATIAAALDFVLTFRQSRAISTLPLASKLSAKTIGFQSVIDIIFSAGHFLLAISFYMLLFAAFVLLYVLDNALYYLIFIAYSFWVPQITRNIINNTIDTLSPGYIIGVSIAKLYTPIYLFTYKSNFLVVKTNNFFGIILVLNVSFQVIILFLQRMFERPRLFLPKSLLPERYDYFRKVPQNVLDNAANGRLECVICMEHVNVPQEGNSGNEHVSEECALEEGNGSQYMITPCDHVYHKKCLTQWLDCKLECPFCRAPVPPL